jgi:hypothetical protein
MPQIQLFKNLAKFSTAQRECQDKWLGMWMPLQVE